jgi:hypothetical protein
MRMISATTLTATKVTMKYLFSLDPRLSELNAGTTWNPSSCSRMTSCHTISLSTRTLVTCTFPLSKHSSFVIAMLSSCQQHQQTCYGFFSSRSAQQLIYLRLYLSLNITQTQSGTLQSLAILLTRGLRTPALSIVSHQKLNVLGG